MNRQFSVNSFTNLEDTGFSAEEYSMLKFGSNKIAKKFGYTLATEFFAKYSDVLISNQCVVIPSPYNHVENAASLMTKYFVDELNHLLVEANGEHVETSIIHRKVSYINDYGFLSKEKRKGLIANDRFYLNKKFLKDKTLIFIDDVKITGTHEDKLKDVLANERMNNDAFFVYFAQYLGDSPDIESKINLAAMSTPQDYIKLVLDNDCTVIVRTIKYLLGLGVGQFAHVIRQIPIEVVETIYLGALGEGYYKIPTYQANINSLKEKVNKRS
jgi:hypothetical protein